MCRLSIIVPLLEDNEQFEDTLVSVLQNRPLDAEVLVVHRGSYGDPYGLVDEVRFVPAQATATVIAALNAGLRSATAEIVHFLLPGVLVGQGWTERAVERFEQTDVAAVAPVICDVDDPETILAAGVRYGVGGRRVRHGAGRRLSRGSRVLRRRIHGPVLQAAFYRRAVLQAAGGLDEPCGAVWADVDLGLSLGYLGYRCVLEPASVVTARSDALANAENFRTGRGAERTFWRHIGAQGWVRSLACHPLVVLASLLAGGTRLSGYTHTLGRLVSALNCLGHASHASRLRSVAHHLDEQDEVNESSVERDASTGRPINQEGYHTRRRAA